jgi:hypothetical protein
MDILREETAKGWRDPYLVERFFEFLQSRLPQLK